MKKSLVLACFSVVLSPFLCIGAPGGDDESARHTEKAGKFSFLPPTDWTVRKMPGIEYKMVFGPAQAGFASNINVILEPNEGTLDDYVKANLPALKRVLKKLNVVEQGEFKTTSGLRGVRLIIEDEQHDRLLRQTFYFFGTADRKYVVTCSTLAEDGAKLDQLFERTMKTFRLED